MSRAFKCTVPECKTKPTFKRKGDLNRHMKKHDRSVTFPCPVNHCHRKEDAFYRKDKVKDHVAKVHSEHEECDCLYRNCDVKAIPLHILRFHIYQSHTPMEGDYSLPYSTVHFRCDLKECKKLISGDQVDCLQRHLRDHDRSSLRNQADIVRYMGFDVNTLAIICPICQVRLASAALFVEHLEDRHLFADPEHWRSFKASFGGHCNWDCDRLWTDYYKRDGTLADRMCPYCRQFACSGVYHPRISVIDHHLSLLSKSGDVLVFRNAIARIIPGFVYHPIFNDIRGGWPSAAC